MALAAELCDGWLPLFFSPKEDDFYRGCLAEGFAASGEPGKADRFEIAAPMTIVPGDDVEQCADAVRPMLALYAGGMGARGANFHFDVFARMGWEAEATKIQELYLAGRKAEAIASVPLAMVEDVALVGPVDKIRGELERWRETCLTTMLVSGPKEALPFYAELILGLSHQAAAGQRRQPEQHRHAGSSRGCGPGRRPSGRVLAAATMAMAIAHRAGRPARTTAAGGRHQARYHGCTAGPSDAERRAGPRPARPGRASGVRHSRTPPMATEAARNRSRTPVTTGPSRNGCCSTQRHDQAERGRERQQGR